MTDLRPPTGVQLPRPTLDDRGPSPAGGPPFSDARILRRAGVCALLLEGAIIAGFGLHRPPPESAVGTASPAFIEAEVVELPKDAAPHLSTASAKPAAPAVPVRERAISVKPGVGAHDPHRAMAPPTENQVSPGPALAPSHGPVVLYSPSPVIPAYLKNQDLSTNVVIEFRISAAGAVDPHLLRTSGNEELDQIALTATRAWKFSPAEEDHRAIDAKIRLRIQFEVH